MSSLQAVVNFTELFNILISYKPLWLNWCETPLKYHQELTRFREVEQMQKPVEGTLCSSFHLSFATPRTQRLRPRAGYSPVRLKFSCPTLELAYARPLYPY